MSRIAAIKPLGQRIWLDNLSRGLLQSGELQKLLDEDAIAGVTSNPAIFYKSISSDPLYAADLAALKAQNLSAEQRYEALVIPDIQATCDLNLPQYKSSEGLDGYVSLEVSPYLANDAQGTVDNAKRLWAAVNRPNAMIKVPATHAGILAFEQLIAAGINVNITLMFSLKQTDDVLTAYIRGLEARQAAGEPIGHVRAVASVFLSRVDVLLDKQLETIGSPEALALRGKSAIAFVKVAYEHYKQLFHGTRFAKLQAAGAHPQRLLWASTGTKNPAYRDVLYVEELIGPETVNTVPDATLNAFRDHGEAANKLETGTAEAIQTLAALRKLGIDFNSVGEQLQVDGLKLFDEAFDKLLELTK
ncbi:transaldolase [Andreprevotia lacus DSM 23236]|jgi:transaldolase|uniref:Transaldolase n=1 Tax=Andreprevotia lacus DSM 23236 TaxID=1121001 RepID=A0A1W1X1M0_9NEIS|nr:transaldolase [Andreprevotia lacus]SMC17842.1 transaldolase [Andreprevotia lacus DSM 23236]